MYRVYNKFARSLVKFKLEPTDADKVAIALSGGPDSVALAAMTARWHQHSGSSAEPPLALVVDHRLRPESADEAHEAAQRAAAMGLRSRVLTVDWGGSVPKRHQKMRAARDARYELLMNYCKHAGAAHLMTAHHADDQAETFLLRLIHASGLDGLAGMTPVNNTFVPSHGVRILRPLLSAHKSELALVCSELELPFASDPTNEDPSFQRNRLRLLLQEAAATELVDAAAAAAVDVVIHNEEQPSARFENSSRRPSDPFFVPQVIRDVLTLQRLCARVSREQQHEATKILNKALLHAAPSTRLTPRPATRWVLPQPGYDSYQPRRRLIHWPSQLAALSSRAKHVPHAILQLWPFANADETILIAALSHLLQAVSGSVYPPSLSDCTRLAQRLAEGKMVGGFTGGGCTVQPIVLSRGRFMLVVPQKHQPEMAELLKAPPRHKRSRTKSSMATTHNNNIEYTSVDAATASAQMAIPRQGKEETENSDSEGFFMQEAAG